MSPQDQHLTHHIAAPNPDLAVLKTHFPQLFSKSGAFDFEGFRARLQTQNPGLRLEKESYTLDWLGKSYARLLATDGATTLLRPNTAHNARPENAGSENLLLKGDNLEVLKHLSHAYHEKVKMIYIDPPYNTGNDGFVYQDDRKFSHKELQSLAGIDEIQAKRILQFTQSKSNSHSAWLTFMYPRLYIARQLLREDGVVFISIDDNEVAQLRMLMDEIFGEENFVAEFVWNTGRKSMAKLVATNHEYCLVYARNINLQAAEEIGGDEEEESNGKFWRERKTGLEPVYAEYEKLKKIFGDNYSEISKGLKEFFKALSDDNVAKAHDHYNLVDAKGIYFAGDISQGTGTGGRFDVLHPITGMPCKVPNGGWRFNEKNLPEILSKQLIHFGEDENTIPNLKRYLTETELEVPSSVFYKDARGAKKRLKNLLGADAFPFPKDETIIKKFIRFVTTSHDLILDFFAGSGTTGEAVMRLNAEDGGKRRFILVQLPEAIDPKGSKAAYDFVRGLPGAPEPTIFEITRERLLRAAAKISAEKPEDTGDRGFRILETMPIWEDYDFEADDFHPQAVLFDETKLTPADLEALRTTWKTADGLLLTEDLAAVDLAGYPAHYGSGRLYLMERGFSTAALKALLERADADGGFNPTLVVAFGYHFESARLRELAENLKNVKGRKEGELDFITRW